MSDDPYTYLADAINSLKFWLQEQADPEHSKYLPLGKQSMAHLIIDLKENTEKYLIELTEAIDELNGTMTSIAEIQQRALKWQEMFG